VTDTDTNTGTSMCETFRTRQFLWNPQQDITAYELAMCLKVLLVNPFDVIEAFKALPENCTRHFEEVKNG
jgi:hypothetical protein